AGQYGAQHPEQHPPEPDVQTLDQAHQQPQQERQGGQQRYAGVTQQARGPAAIDVQSAGQLALARAGSQFSPPCCSRSRATDFWSAASAASTVTADVVSE